MVNINLLPVEIKEKLKQAKQSANIFSICLVIVILSGVMAFLVDQTNRMLVKPNLESSKDKLVQSEQSLKKYSDLEEKAIFINDRAKTGGTIDEQRAVWSEVLADLISSVPQTVQFESLNADVSKVPNFVLNAKTSSEREIIRFKEKLEKSNFFKNVTFKSSNAAQTVDPQNTATILNFSLEFNLEEKRLKAETK